MKTKTPINMKLLYLTTALVPIAAQTTTELLIAALTIWMINIVVSCIYCEAKKLEFMFAKNFTFSAAFAVVVAIVLKIILHGV